MYIILKKNCNCRASVCNNFPEDFCLCTENMCGTYCIHQHLCPGQRGNVPVAPRSTRPLQCCPLSAGHRQQGFSQTGRGSCQQYSDDAPSVRTWRPLLAPSVIDVRHSRPLLRLHHVMRRSHRRPLYQAPAARRRQLCQRWSAPRPQERRLYRNSLWRHLWDRLKYVPTTRPSCSS